MYSQAYITKNYLPIKKPQAIEIEGHSWNSLWIKPFLCWAQCIACLKPFESQRWRKNNNQHVSNSRTHPTAEHTSNAEQIAWKTRTVSSTMAGPLTVGSHEQTINTDLFEKEAGVDAETQFSVVEKHLEKCKKIRGIDLPFLRRI